MSYITMQYYMEQVGSIYIANKDVIFIRDIMMVEKNKTCFWQIGRVPLREQVSYFERSIDYMVRMIGENGTEEMLRKAMLTITIGSNDILNYYIQPSIPSFSQDKLPIDALQNSMVFHLTTHFKVLNIVLYVDT